MAMSKDELIAAKARSCKGFKGALTRKISVAQRSLEVAQAQPVATDIVLKELRLSVEDVKNAYDKLEACLVELQALESDDKFEGYEQRLREEEDRKEQVMEVMTPVIAKYEFELRPRSPVPVTAVAAATTNAPPKPNDALKPKVLGRDATPVEVTAWIERFIAYHRSSRLDKTTLLEQQAYFKAFLDAFLNSRLRGKIQNNTPVLDDPTDESCLDMLRSEFLIRHPLFNRRLAFYEAKQEQGQDFTDFAEKLQRHGDEADLRNIPIDDTYVMRYFTAVTDDKLQEEFLRLKSPTKQEMLETAANYEQGKRYKTAIRKLGTEKSNAVSSSSSRTKGSSSNSRGEAPAWKQLKSKLVRERRCFRCGDSLPKEESSHKCKAIDSTCKNCDRVGHFAGVCFMKGSKDGKSTGAKPKKPAAKANAAQDGSAAGANAASN